jgi:hypothetical protein
MEESAAVNPRWRKSSYSNGGAANCIEAGHVPGAILIRDTKDNGTGPVLRVTPTDWQRFTARVRTTVPIS